MKAGEESFTFLKNQNIYIIPFFQRGYVWKEDNWIDLWEELSSDKKDCFLGSIILKDSGEDKEGFHTKTVIDGQQRITTLSIVIRSLNDAYNKKYNNEGIEEELKPFLYFTKKKRSENGTEDVEFPKLIPSKNDVDIFNNVISGKYEKTYESDDITHPIFECYKFFRDKMKEVDNSILSRIEDKLTIDDRKIIVKIDLSKEEREQVIFDTINSAGVKLTSADIIKNALYQKINDLEPKKVYGFYEETWYEHFEKDEKLKAWLEDRVTGRIIRTSLDMFLQAFAVINGFYDPQKNNLQDLPDLYKEKLNNMSLSDTKKMISELCEYSDVYYENFVGFSSTTSLRYDENKKRLLHILHNTDTSTFDAYVLKILMNDKNEVEQKLKLAKLESYVMRNYITGNTTNIKNYNKDSMQLINDKASIDDWLVKDDLSNLEVKNGLKNLKGNDKPKLILFWVQMYRQNDLNKDMQQTSMVYNYELEHVMPQKWEKFWGIEYPTKDEEGNDLSLEKKEKIIKKLNDQRTAAVYEIGNMTLLRSKLNKTLSNKTFKEKVDGCIVGGKKQEGMKANCSLSITTEITDLDEWNENTISDRTEKLFKEIVKIWPNKF